MSATFVGFGVVSLLALAWGLVRERRRGAALRRAFDTANDELQRLQASFSRFAPRSVVEGIAAEGAARRAERREVTILFADLVGFSRLAERLEPSVLVQILNEYFASMSRAVAGHQGHVSKFIGDGMLVLFGVQEGNPWQANDAAHASLAMRAALARLNEDLAARQLPQLGLGIGIHRGTVIAGVIGNDLLSEFTVIGSAVNLAARVERLTRQHGVDILITEAVKEALDPRFSLRPMPAASVRGFSEPVATYALEGFT